MPIIKLKAPFTINHCYQDSNGEDFKLDANREIEFDTERHHLRDFLHAGFTPVEPMSNHPKETNEHI